MPELPEVETVCRGLDRAITGDTLARVTLHRDGLRFPFPPALKKLKDLRVTAIRRRAKYCLWDLSDGRTLIMHLGMTGRVLIVPPATRHAAEKHDHAVFHFGSGTRVVFNDARRFGFIDLAPTASLHEHDFFAHLGPEPLDSKTFTPRYLTAALAARATPVKVAIMDQQVVVGVGNIYASESLFMAGIDPRTPARDVDAAHIKKLVTAIRRVLARAIKAGGSTLSDYRQADGELGYFQHSFSVYDRAGERCPGCTCRVTATGGVQKITQGGRSTFFCPARQTG